ncbi:hypothetical protein CAOG_008760 [Capsaspora owczarzaki ATCC 30864]|uniref:PA14 domain-containing protein n=2 Tax=Capsaspora owczarzaki (strain ATCC 30864) TaxID=595528 RepID=A0A0D2WQR7_CAPO3|nr:hypothetical protein CAOG_008760 [Capsaspora owczarzaki ATCC 30864]
MSQQQSVPLSSNTSEVEEIGRAHARPKKVHHIQLNEVVDQTFNDTASSLPMDKTTLARGFVNSHIFQGLCGGKVARSKHHALFPRFPTVKRRVASLTADFADDEYFQRVFGFIVPKVTGMYRFAVASDDTSEFWLSTDNLAEHERLLCFVGRPEDPENEVWTHPGDYSRYSSQISQPVHLDANRAYFMELFHKQSGGGAHVSVAWQPPSETEFAVIEKEFLMGYENELDELHSATDGHDHGAAAAPPSHRHYFEVEAGTEISPSPAMDPRTEFWRIPRVPPQVTLHVLETCEYHPSYLANRKLNRYEGVSMVEVSEVFPDDSTGLLFNQQPESANPLIPTDQAKAIVVEYLDLLNARRPNDTLVLKRVVNIVNKRDRARGALRTLLEIDVAPLHSPDKVQRLSQYVYRPSAAEELCYPSGMVWNATATIHLVIPVKNQVAWVAHLIENLEALWIETRDEHVNLVLVDFDSTDGDYEAMLRRSRIPHYTFVRKTGNFERTTGIQAGVDTVQNANDIVFTCDLHLDIPATLLDDIRKHTIASKQVYAPLVVRLGCGFTPAHPNGFWEHAGYGLLSIVKRDFDRIGGMNTREFGDRWGGEDWELLDRVLSANLEVERLRQPRFYHFWHSRKGMWSGTA